MPFQTHETGRRISLGWSDRAAQEVFPKRKMWRRRPPQGPGRRQVCCEKRRWPSVPQVARQRPRPPHMGCFKSSSFISAYALSWTFGSVAWARLHYAAMTTASPHIRSSFVGSDH